MADRTSSVEPNAAFRTLRAVRDAHQVTGSKRVVLWVLAMHADGATGENAWPKIDTIAAESGLKVTAVKDALNALAAAGAIRHTGDHQVGAGRPVKVWKLALDVLAALTGEDTGDRKPVSGAIKQSGADCSNSRETAANSRETAMTNPLRTQRPTPSINGDGPTVPAGPGEVTPGQRILLDAAETYLWDAPDAEPGYNVETLLAALAATRKIEHPARWLAKCLAHRDADAGKRFIRSLWLSDVAGYDDTADMLTLAEVLADVGLIGTDDEAAVVWAAMRADGVAAPGLYVRRIAADGPTGVDMHLAESGWLDGCDIASWAVDRVERQELLAAADKTPHPATEPVEAPADTEAVAASVPGTG